MKPILCLLTFTFVITSFVLFVISNQPTPDEQVQIQHSLQMQQIVQDAFSRDKVSLEVL